MGWDQDNSTFTGTVCTDVILSTQNESPLAKFRVAVHKGKTAEGAEITDFKSVDVWGKPAENISKTLRKGAKVTVSAKVGPLTLGEDKNGKPMVWQNFKAIDVTYDSRENATASAGAQSQQSSPPKKQWQQKQATQYAQDESIPF